MSADFDWPSHAGAIDEIRKFSINLSSKEITVLWVVGCLETNQKSLDNMVAVVMRAKL